MRGQLSNFLASLPLRSTLLGPAKGVHLSTPDLFRQRHPAYADCVFISLDQPQEFLQNAPSENLTAEKVAVFHNPFRVRRPETWVAKIPGGRVWGKTVAVIGPDDHFLADVSVNWEPPYGSHPVLDRFFLKWPHRIRGTAVVMATTGGNSYFHWLFDILPRLDLLRRAKIDYSQVTWLFNSPLNLFQVETLSYLGVMPKQMVYLSNQRHCIADELIVPSLPDSIGDISPATVTFLKKSFIKKCRYSGRTPERIFLQRESQESRKIANQTEILQSLAPLGFVPMIPEEYPWIDQLCVFYNAKVVVGAHGGALANLVFSQPETLCVEFLASEYVNKCFWGLAHQVGARHAYAVCPSSQGRLQNAASRSNLKVPLDAISRLAEILA